MFTRCPACETVFRVNPAILRVAQGQVRCGQCAEVFNALLTLSDDPRQFPAAAAAREAETQTTAAQATATQTTATQTTATQTTATQAVENEAAENEENRAVDTSLADRLVNAQQPDETGTASEVTAEPEDAGVAAEADAEQEAEYTARTFAPVELDFKPDELAGFGSELSEFTAAQTATAPEPGAEPAADTDLELVLAAAAEQQAEPVPDSGAEPGEAAAAAEEIEEITLEDVPEPDDAQPFISDAAAPAGAAASVAVPTIPLEDAQAALLMEEPESRAGAWLAWGVAVLVLLSLLGGQWIYMQRVPLYEKVELRPWLQRFCRTFHCSLPLVKAPGRIEVVDRMVHEHPRVPQALWVELSFVSRAKEIIAYPVLELRLSDMTGNRVAARRFLPSEYLPTGINAAQGLVPNVVTPVTLEVLMPDATKVVSFQFDFL